MTWSSVVSAQALPVYQTAVVNDVAWAWCGLPEVIFATEVSADDYAAYSAGPGATATTVQDEDDAIAHVVGLGAPINPRNADGTIIQSFRGEQVDAAIRVVNVGRIGSETIHATHSFSNPETWYSESTRHTEIALTDVGGVWSDPAHVNWIDMRSGRTYKEDKLRELVVHGYEVVVEVEATPGVWTTKTLRTRHAASSGHYTVNYLAGEVTPVAGESWTGLAVRASFSKSGGSKWILTPASTKSLVIEKAEVQFSSDVVYNAPFLMEIVGYVETFAPTYWDQSAPVGPLAFPRGASTPPSGSPGDVFYNDTTNQMLTFVDGYGWAPIPPGPFPAGYRVPIGNTVYDTIDQMIDDAIESYPIIPALSPGTSRGYTSPRNIFQFHYGTTRTLFPSLGMQIHISLTGDEAMGGERCTATFYCVSEVDPGGPAALALLSE
jgi:hypothetical protein